MDVVIKPVGKTDGHILRNVADDVFDHAVTTEHLSGYLAAPGHTMCVAVANGVVVGQVRAVLHLHPDRAPELYIDNAGVTPAFQRQGIATRLLAEIVRWGKAHGCTDIWVGTETDNEPARALYDSLGLTMQPTVMFEGPL